MRFWNRKCARTRRYAWTGDREHPLRSAHGRDYHGRLASLCHHHVPEPGRKGPASGDFAGQRAGAEIPEVRAVPGRRLRPDRHLRRPGRRAPVRHGPVPGGDTGLEGLHPGAGPPQQPGQRALRDVQPGLRLPVAQPRHRQRVLRREPHHLAGRIHQAAGLLDHLRRRAEGDQPALRPRHRLRAR